jgi:hypothetical protein
MHTKTLVTEIEMLKVVLLFGEQKEAAAIIAAEKMTNKKPLFFSLFLTIFSISFRRRDKNWLYVLDFVNKINNNVTNTALAIAFIALAVVLVAGTSTSTTLLNRADAQTLTLGEPFLVEKGKTTGQTEIGPNRTEYTYSANGTLNGTIEITDTGKYVSISKGNNATFDQGQGVVATKDGSEMANYTLIEVSNVTQDGKYVFQGAVVYSTNSTGNLAFLDNTVSIFKGEGDTTTGDFTSTEWEWK